MMAIGIPMRVYDQSLWIELFGGGQVKSTGAC